MKTVLKEKKKSKQQNKACQALIEKTIAKLVDRLEQGYSDGMKEYFKAMSYFRKYSINNLFLIMAQKPEATQVAGFRTWQKLNRKVKKGEKGIRILAPVVLKKKEELIDHKQDEENSIQSNDEAIMCFRSVCVFDKLQTKGAPLPEPTRAHGDAIKLIPKMEEAIHESGIVLEYKNTGADQGKSFKGKIIIKPGMSSAETFSTLTHEFAHELLHQKRDSSENKTIRELETDAVACVVCERYGINTIQASADYIKLWDGDKTKLLKRMDRIRYCSQEIIQRIENGSNPSMANNSA